MESPTGAALLCRAAAAWRGCARDACVADQRRAHVRVHATARTRIAQLLGPRSFETLTWSEPEKPPHLSVSEWFGEKIAGGAWVRVTTHGTINGTAHAGEMMIGWNGSVYEMSWVDSYHTAGAIMVSQGAERADGVIAVTCSFAAGDETWRWRTELHETLMRAFVIKPAGEESLAIATLWR